MGVLSKPSYKLRSVLYYIWSSPKRSGSVLGILFVLIVLYNRRNRKLREDLLKKSTSFTDLGKRKRKKIGNLIHENLIIRWS